MNEPRIRYRVGPMPEMSVEEMMKAPLFYYEEGKEVDLLMFETVTMITEYRVDYACGRCHKNHAPYIFDGDSWWRWSRWQDTDKPIPQPCPRCGAPWSDPK